VTANKATAVKTPDPVLRVVFDLTGIGIRNIQIFASNANLRDEGVRRLIQAKPALEILEEALCQPLPPE